MKKSVIAVAAALAAGGVLFAAQADATPTTPAPTPAVSPGSAAAAVRGAGVGWFFRALTDDQRRCLADAGLQRPQGKLTDGQRTALAKQVRDAIAGCGVTLPEKITTRPRLGFAWASLTPAQQDCLAGTVLTRPVGRLTEAERTAVRQSMLDAARSCGIGG